MATILILKQQSPFMQNLINYHLPMTQTTNIWILKNFNLDRRPQPTVGQKITITIIKGVAAKKGEPELFDQC